MPSKITSPLSTQAILTFIVGLLALNAIGILMLSIQVSSKQPTVVIMSHSVESKLDAIQAKLASFQAQVRMGNTGQLGADEF